MKDQAEGLRLKLRELHQSPAKTAAVISGKGGVGKSNISVNIAVILAQLGKKFYCLIWILAWRIFIFYQVLVRIARL